MTPETEHADPFQRLGWLIDDQSFRYFSSMDLYAFRIGQAKIAGRTVLVVMNLPTTNSPTGVYKIDVMGDVETLRNAVDWAVATKTPIVLLFDNPIQNKRFGAIPIDDPGLLLHPEFGFGAMIKAVAHAANHVPLFAGLFGRIRHSTSLLLSLNGAIAQTVDAQIELGQWSGTVARGDSRDFAAMSLLTGLADQVFATDHEVITWLQQLVMSLPASWGNAPVVPEKQHVDIVVPVLPGDARSAFDPREWIDSLCDAETFVELQSGFAREAVVGFGRIGGASVGVVANRSTRRGGLLYTETCDKIADFLEQCELYRFPVLFLVDCGGFSAEDAGSGMAFLRRCGRLFRVLEAVSTPKFAAVFRRAYSAGFYAMGGSGFADRVVAFPGAKIGYFGKEMLFLLRQNHTDAAAKAFFDELEFLLEHPEKTIDFDAVERIIDPGKLREEVVTFLKAT